jgi:hypothetical protein
MFVGLLAVLLMLITEQLEQALVNLSNCVCTSADLNSLVKCIRMKEKYSFTVHLLVWIYTCS